jgi:hypothetical protein
LQGFFGPTQKISTYHHKNHPKIVPCADTVRCRSDYHPLSICKPQRIHAHKVFRGIATRGHCSVGWFFGIDTASGDGIQTAGTHTVTVTIAGAIGSFTMTITL